MAFGRGEGVNHLWARLQDALANLFTAAGGLDNRGSLGGLLLVEVPADCPAIANRLFMGHSEMHKPVGNACLGGGVGKSGGGDQEADRQNGKDAHDTSSVWVMKRRTNGGISGVVPLVAQRVHARRFRMQRTAHPLAQEFRFQPEPVIGNGEVAEPPVDPGGLRRPIGAT